MICYVLDLQLEAENPVEDSKVKNPNKPRKEARFLNYHRNRAPTQHTINPRVKHKTLILKSLRYEQLKQAHKNQPVLITVKHSNKYKAQSISQGD